MREVLLKIVDSCPCNCAFCNSNELFNSRFDRKTFDLATWLRIANDLIATGLEVAIVTGGEPLTRRDVALPLVRHFKAAGVFVSINTSGAAFTSQSLLPQLIGSYPDLLVFSIDSSHPAQHDENRVRQGLFSLILSTISKLKDDGDHPIAIRVVITNRNYRQLPEIIRLFHSHGVDCMKFTHIENDPIGEYTLSKDQLIDFHRTVRPRILEALDQCDFESADLRVDAINKFTHLLTEEFASYAQLSKGQFSPSFTDDFPCAIITRFSVVQSNGQVLPCCEAEHHYDLVLGNLATTPASALYSRSNAEYQRLLTRRQDYCTNCTEPHNMQINFRSRTVPVQKR